MRIVPEGKGLYRRDCFKCGHKTPIDCELLKPCEWRSLPQHERAFLYKGNFEELLLACKGAEGWLTVEFREGTQRGEADVLANRLKEASESGSLGFYARANPSHYGAAGEAGCVVITPEGAGERPR